MDALHEVPMPADVEGKNSAALYEDDSVFGTVELHCASLLHKALTYVVTTHISFP